MPSFPRPPEPQSAKTYRDERRRQEKKARIWARLAVDERLSLWDANTVRSALAVGARTLWSEDLQHGRRFDRLVVRNPFWRGVSEDGGPEDGKPLITERVRRRRSPR